MEHRNLQQHFAYLVEKGFPPGIIRRKMALDLNGYNLMAQGYIRGKELSAQKVRAVEQAGLANAEELKLLWTRIEDVVAEYRNETDYKRKCIIEEELEDLSIEYSEKLMYVKIEKL